MSHTLIQLRFPSLPPPMSTLVQRSGKTLDNIQLCPCAPTLVECERAKLEFNYRDYRPFPRGLILRETAVPW